MQTVTSDVAGYDLTNREQFALFVDAYCHCVRAIVFSVIRDTDETDDLTQETLRKAFRAKQTFQPGTDAIAWVSKIALNVARDRLRRKSRRVSSTSLDAAMPGGDSSYAAEVIDPNAENPSSRLEYDEFLEFVHKKLGEWPIAKRNVAIMVLDQLGVEEVAERNGTTVATEASRMTQCRNGLKLIIQKWKEQD